MPSLFDKLNAMKEEQEKEQKQETPPESPAEIPQCACGSSLEGECPECDGGAPEDKRPAQERLKELGGQRKVNPPEGDQESPEAQQETPTSPPAEDKEKCPTCGKSFKHLSRHKCKQEAPPPEEKPSTDAQEPPQPPEESQDPEVPAETAAPKRGGFVLVLDAILERHNHPPEHVHYFADLIQPVCEAVAKENKEDWWSVIEYGKGPGYLASRFEKFLEYTDIKGIVLADSTTPECKACKEVLKRRALSVIQGVR